MKNYRQKVVVARLFVHVAALALASIVRISGADARTLLHASFDPPIPPQINITNIAALPFAPVAGLRAVAVEIWARARFFGAHNFLPIITFLAFTLFVVVFYVPASALSRVYTAPVIGPRAPALDLPIA